MSGMISMRQLAQFIGSAKDILLRFLSVGLNTLHSSRYSVAILLSIATLMSPPLTLLAKSPVASASVDQNKSAVVARTDEEVYYLNAVNNLRAGRGLAPMVIDSRLTSSARNKGNDMVLQHYWDHYAPSGIAFSDYIWNLSPRANHVGENLARCFDTRSAAFDALVASPTHYAVMVGSFTNFGVSEVTEPISGCTYTTMHFSDYNN